MTEIKILSANCQGLGNSEKRIDVFNYLKSKKCHIYCLQDTHSSKLTENFIRCQWNNNECILSSMSSNSRGVGIFFNNNIDFQIHSHISDPDGNFIIADLTVDNNRFTLVTLYGPNSDSPLFFEQLIGKAQQFNNNKLIMCGDYNCIQDVNLDYYNYKHINNKKAHEKILDLKIEHNLIDPFREINPHLIRYTWRKPRPLKQSRLDYFLITENLFSSVNSCSIESSYRSDHSMVILNITFNKFNKHKPLWKHNNSLLHDIDYLNSINKKISEIKAQYAIPIYNPDNLNDIPNQNIQFTINDQLFLEVLLMELRGQSISYSCYKKKQTDNRESELIDKIEKLEHNLTDNDIQSLEICKEELKNIRKHKLNGHLIRSRAQIIEDDEKPSQFFCNLETHNYTSKLIPKLRKPNGDIITDQYEILEETKTFYENLYSSRDNELDDVDLNDELSDFIIPKLDKEESAALEGLLTFDECSHF